MTRIEHKGAAKVTTITAEVDPTALTIPLADGTNWPDGSIGLFYMSLNKGALTEEKILCSGRAGNTIQVFSDVSGNGRGADGTVAQTHPVNSPAEHVWTATEADQANAHINETSGAHGYPAPANLVTLDGDQTITGVKTMQAPILETPVVTDPAATGGTHTAATKMSLSGAQAEAEFRVRNTYIGVGDPDNSLGNDGDLFISKA
jgi:hypothetical protein